MKTTIDVPDELLHRAKIVAAQRRTTLKDLIVAGLDRVLRSDSDSQSPERKAALERLQKGFRLGADPLTRDQTHERD
jgi:hypothetical protein